MAAGGELEPPDRETVFFDLARDEVATSDLQLLFLGVTRKTDHFHPIQEGRLNGVGDVAGGDEEYFREVVDDPEVMIAEGVILLRIEDLEEGG